MAILGLVVLCATLLAGEAGFRVGDRLRPRVAEAVKSYHATIQTSLLGLLALLLGFSFAMAESRYDARKRLAVDDANAIGTAGLRTRAVPDPEGAVVRGALARYVDARLALSRRGRHTGVAEELASTQPVEEEAWPRAAELARRHPRSVPVGLLLQSLNQVIDSNALRVTFAENHIPTVVLVVLGLVAAAAMAWVGLGMALAGRRSPATLAVVAVLIALVVAVIVDLDQPGLGVIRIGPDMLVDVRRKLG